MDVERENAARGDDHSSARRLADGIDDVGRRSRRAAGPQRLALVQPPTTAPLKRRSPSPNVGAVSRSCQFMAATGKVAERSK